MAAISYLLKRGGRYSFRMAVPKGLRGVLRCAELTRSLKTGELYEAKERAAILLPLVLELFKILSMTTDLTQQQIEELSKRYFYDVVFPSYEAWVERTRTGNRFELMPSFTGESRPNAPTVDKVVEGIIHPQGYPEHDFLFTMANAVMEKYGVKLDREANPYKELTVHGMGGIKGEIEGLVTRYANHKLPHHQVQTEWLKKKEVQAQAVQSAITVNQLFERYERANGHAYEDATREAHRTALRFWQDLFGDTPVATVDNDKAQECLDALLKMPSNWTKSKAYRGKTPAELMAMAIPENERASGQTVGNRIRVYIKMWDWLITRGEDGITHNPFKILRLPTIGNARTRRLPYTNEHLAKIFSSPVYAGSESAGRRGVIGKVIIWDGLYWVPLISLLTGARMNEICQLYCADIRQEGNIWVMDINESGDDKKLKTDESSARLIPLHSRLLDIGFLDYLERQKQQEEQRLFPDIRLGAGGSYADTFTRKYAHYINKGIKMKRTSQYVFHSFRHNVAHELRQLGIREDVSMSILGHSNNHAHANYGGDYLKSMKAALEKVTYTSIDWNLIKKGAAHAKLISEL